MRRNGGIIGPITNFVLGDSVSGSYDMHDVHQYKSLDKWPYAPAVSLSTSPFALDETNNATLTVTATSEGFPNGATLYWTVNQVSGTVVSGDFEEGFQGSFTVSGGLGPSTDTFDIVVAPDGTPDGTDQFNVQIRTGSYSGPIIATSSTVAISDTSTEPSLGETLGQSFFPIAEFDVGDNASDTASNYSVSQIQSSYSGTGRLYLGHKVSGLGEQTYFYDAPIACIQVLNAAGTTVNQQWWFGSSPSNGVGWETHTNQSSVGPIGYGLFYTPSQAAALPYSVVASGATANRFNLATSTGSSSTGAIGGIFAPTGPMPLGEQTIIQQNATYYMYRETSGSSAGFTSFCRSPSRTWSAGEIIRIAYIIGNRPAADAYFPEDTFFVGIA